MKLNEFGAGIERRIWLPFLSIVAATVVGVAGLSFFGTPSPIILWAAALLYIALVMVAGAMLVRKLVPGVRELAVALERVAPGCMTQAPPSADDITTLIQTVGTIVSEMRSREQTAIGDLAKRNQLLQQLSRTLQEQAASFESTLNSVDMAVCLFEGNGNIVQLNQKFSGLLGIESEKLKKMGFLPIVSELRKLIPEPEKLVATAEEIYRQPSVPRSAIIRLRDGSGSLRIYCAPVLGELSSLIGIVISGGESTDASVVDRLKSEFISTVSHELRTPLTAIHGALGLVLGGAAGAITGSIRELLEIADNNADRMIQLVNDILEVFRIESGKLRLQPQPVDVLSLVNRTCERTQKQADAASVLIETRIPAGLPPVLADAEQIEIVLEKLISNAIKYSEPGRSVVVGAEPMPSSAEFMVVWVQDFGCGIPLEAQERIFEKFEQAEDVMTRKHQGPGLGLAICRGIIEGHGGRIWLKSEPGAGSIFYLSIPTSRSGAISAQSQRTLTESLSLDHGEHYLVMVIEDDADSRNVITRILESGGHFVMGLEEGSRVMNLALRHGPDVITLDLILAGASGLDVLQELKSDERTRKIPVICVSISDDLAPRALELGAAQYIRKPVDPNTLLGAVRAAYTSVASNTVRR